MPTREDLTNSYEVGDRVVLVYPYSNESARVTWNSPGGLTIKCSDGIYMAILAEEEISLVTRKQRPRKNQDK